MRPGWMCVAALFVACTKPDPAPTAAASASAVADDGDSACFSPEKSMEYAKPHKSAEAPYAECAAGIFSHCPPNDSYCSIALNVASTKQARADGKKLCCYGK